MDDIVEERCCANDYKMFILRRIVGMLAAVMVAEAFCVWILLVVVGL